MNKSYRTPITVFVLVSASLAGCDTEHRDVERSLSALDNPRLVVQVLQERPAEPFERPALTALESIPQPLSGVVLSMHLEHDSKLAAGECVTVPGLEAVLRTASVSVSAGGWRERSSDGEVDAVCGAPSLHVQLDFIERSLDFNRRGITLTVRDGTRALSAPLGDFLIQRNPALVTPRGGSFRPGEDLQVRWDPATDLDSALPAFLYDTGTIDAGSVQRVGDIVTAKLPQSLEPRAGYILRPVLTFTPPCSDECVLSVRYSLPLRFDVVAP